MSQKYPILSSPVQIGSVTVKNRFVMPSMGTNFANPDHSASDKHFAYIEARAKGGVGLIMMEYSCVDLSGLAAPFQLGCFDDIHIPGMARLADIAHRYGAKIGMQLQHGGVQAITEVRLGPSATADGIKEMTKEEIAKITKAFADAAKVSDWAQEGMKWAVSNGLMEGDGVNLRPGDSIKRIELAALLMNFLEK